MSCYSRLVWCVLFFLSSLSSCGYQLRRGDKPLAALGSLNIQDRAQRVYVPLVENMTTQVGPEAVLTNAVREVFSIQPGLRVVNSESEADYVLVGRVLDYGSRYKSSTSQASQTSEQKGGLASGQVTAADIEVYLAASFSMMERVYDGQGQLLQRQLWVKAVEEELSIEAFNRFAEAEGASSGPQINRSRERLQLRNLSGIIARRVLDQVTQDF